jgi:DNA-binding transcriptional MerR regulator
MDIDREDLDLIELADAAGVTPRTIRYYVQQGLLPSPGTRGPKTKYDRALLDRLQLIKLLQRQHLPLSEIRRRLEGLDEEGIRAELGAPPELALRDSARGYIGAVMSKIGRSPQIRERDNDLFSQQEPRPSRPVMKSTWERITLARDVELHIRRPLSREQNRLVDRLIAEARNIFPEEP